MQHKSWHRSLRFTPRSDFVQPGRHARALGVGRWALGVGRWALHENHV
jgi:hypothetical protein